MERSDIAIARFPDHDGAETAIKTLAQGGFDMKQLSIVGRGYHTDESIVGFYNAGDRIRFWGRYGAFWGGLWGLFSGGIFLTVPAIGPLVALGAFAGVIVAIIEGAILGAGGSALTAALYSIGIPKDSILDYEQTLKADGFLVLVHGTAVDVAQARTILTPLKPVRLDIHEGMTNIAIGGVPAQAAE